MQRNAGSTRSKDERINRAVAELLEMEERGQCPDPVAWLNRHADLRPALSSFLRNHLACKLADDLQAAASVAGPAGHSGAAEEIEVAELVQSGELVGRDYKIIRPLGRGGMGIVYQAEHVRLKDMRAVKFLPRGAVTDSMLKRFLREARKAASIKHPNVIKVHDVGQDKDLHFIAMEYVEGCTLADYYRDVVKARPDRAFPWPLAAQLMIPVLDALGAVHDRGLVHRDIKPSNIMVGSTPLSVGNMHVVLMDFGLVQDDSDASLTNTGAIVGTPAYMAPEQAWGEPTDNRTDIFAVGAAIYFLLAGQHPRTGSKTAILAQVALGHGPTPLTSLRVDIPVDACRIVERAMSRDPSARYASAKEMLDELKQSLHRATPEIKLPVPLPTTHAPLQQGVETVELELADTETGPHAKERKIMAPVELIGKGMPVPIAARTPFANATAVLAGLLLDRDRETIKPFVSILALLAVVVLLGWLLSIQPDKKDQNIAKPDEAVAALGQAPPPTTRAPAKREDTVLIRAGIARLGASEERLRAHAKTLPLFQANPEAIDDFIGACQNERREAVHVEAFRIDRYEVTNAQYAEFVRATGHAPPASWSAGRPPAGNDDHPVTGVRHSDATAFAAWAGKKLPTIGQWARAYRGDDDRMYPWGDEWVSNRANVLENRLFPEGTSPVHASPQDVSPFGVFNLAGNVSEILRETIIFDDVRTAIAKGSHSEARGATRACAPFRYFLQGEELSDPLIGFRCVIEEP